MEKRESSYTFDGDVNWCSHSGEQHGGSLKKTKTKNTVTLWSNNPALSIYMEKTKTSSKRYMRPNIHNSTIYNSQDMSVSINRRMDKENVVHVWSEVAQSCPTLCNPMDCSLPCSSIHGIFQARVLEWVAIFFSRGSSQPKDLPNPEDLPNPHFRQMLSHLSHPDVYIQWNILLLFSH